MILKATRWYLRREVRFDVCLKGERLGRVQDFIYLESIFHEGGGMDAEISEKILKGRQVAGALGKDMRSRTISLRAWRSRLEGTAPSPPMCRRGRRAGSS